MRSAPVILALVLGLAGCDQRAPRQGAPPPPASLAERIDLNTATIKQLEALPAIGPDRARSIMASRNARGGRFERIDQLLEIDGIGAKTLDAIRPYVTLTP